MKNEIDLFNASKDFPNYRIFAFKVGYVLWHEIALKEILSDMKAKFFYKIMANLVKSFNHFIDLNGLKLSAALSYYTVFSIAPLLIVIISLAAVLYGRDAVEGRVYHQISGSGGQ